ncbi:MULTISPECIES: FKBP-type peptidyl-prolyl cis-trans isomerase [unclassified Nocardioides]|uniref:FKBP-type peptidyl-prolyl cis-trans isomerase n=1 Tax=unclassified Nocardioides TaxID=2615069 RepID=UPI0009F13CEA|nr:MULTISPECIES: FKBP-type peptidyl-prolyl cis-trans isomerase [unclassified Nocardioides]GAW48381.1 Peptidyl-prolyl cis-trans isomerase [Nocardioides sp. PD653-B2]
MSRRLRRLPVLLLPLVLATTLAACGSDSGDSSDGGSSSSASAGALDGVTVTGDPGKEPEVTWDGKMEAGDIETTVLTKGDGEEVASGDQVSAHIWIGNGYTEKKAYSTYDEGQPQSVTVSDDLSPVFKDALEGQTVGSRVAVTSSAENAFGASGNPQLGIGNKDSVLIIVDLISKTTVLDGPQGDEKPAPSWAPGLVQDGDAITGLDFKATPKPDGKLKSAPLIVGDGDVVKKGQTITVNYLGQVYGAKAPFDESYSKGQPASFAIGTGAVISGWDKTLVGVTVGSRIILAIPPNDGYGKEGNSGAGIKGTDTLYFVVDILAAS